MRTIFSATPAFGHILPLLPLARAGVASGSEVAFLTGAAFADVVAPLPLLSAGPSFADLDAEFRRRTGSGDVVALDAEAFGELFGSVRIDMTFDEALEAVRRFDADLIVAEREDTVGPIVAAALDIPWVRFLLGVDLPPEIVRAISAQAAAGHAARGLTPVPPVAVVDPWPEFLQPSGWNLVADRIVIRPEPHSGPEPLDSPLPQGFVGTRPRVLVTPGTIAHNVDAVGALMASLSDLDVDVVLTGRRGAPWPIEVDPRRVQQVGFVPLDQLLRGVDVVVLAGGSGTVTAALSRGLPMVVCPMVFDQFSNAERAADTGAALVAAAVSEVGPKVAEVLANPSYRTKAAALAAQIGAMESADEAWERVKGALCT